MKVLIENFIDKIESGNAEKALEAANLIVDKIPEDEDLRNEILKPEIITKLHELLIEHLGVSPRAMQLNRRFPNNTSRALMFTKAMCNGIAHTMD